MSSLGGVVIVVVAVVLLVAAVLMVRDRHANPWPPVVVAMITSGVCFTVGGDSAADTPGPSIATVVASVVGLLSVVAAVFAMVPPRSHDALPSRVPKLVAAGATVVGALGLLVNQLSG